MRERIAPSGPFVTRPRARANGPASQIIPGGGGIDILVPLTGGALDPQSLRFEIDPSGELRYIGTATVLVGVSLIGAFFETVAPNAANFVLKLDDLVTIGVGPGIFISPLGAGGPSTASAVALAMLTTNTRIGVYFNTGVLDPIGIVRPELLVLPVESS